MGHVVEGGEAPGGSNSRDRRPNRSVVRETHVERRADESVETIALISAASSPRAGRGPSKDERAVVLGGLRGQRIAKGLRQSAGPQDLRPTPHEFAECGRHCAVRQPFGGGQHKHLVVPLRRQGRRELTLVDDVVADAGFRQRFGPHAEMPAAGVRGTLGPDRLQRIEERDGPQRLPSSRKADKPRRSSKIGPQSSHHGRKFVGRGRKVPGGLARRRSSRSKPSVTFDGMTRMRRAPEASDGSPVRGNRLRGQVPLAASVGLPLPPGGILLDRAAAARPLARATLSPELRRELRREVGGVHGRLGSEGVDAEMIDARHDARVDARQPAIQRPAADMGRSSCPVNPTPCSRVQRARVPKKPRACASALGARKNPPATHPSAPDVMDKRQKRGDPVGGRRAAVAQEAVADGALVLRQV